MNKNNLKPAVVFEEFAKINEIPRPSKREEKMIAYLQNWGESHGLLISIRIPSVLTLTVSGLRQRVRRWVPTTVSAVPSSWLSSLRTM